VRPLERGRGRGVGQQEDRVQVIRGQVQAKRPIETLIEAPRELARSNVIASKGNAAVKERPP
jgi:hypothetical protein